MDNYKPYLIKKNILSKLKKKWHDYVDIYNISDNIDNFIIYIEKHSKWDSLNEDGRNTISTSSSLLSKIDSTLFNIYYVDDDRISEIEKIYDFTNENLKFSDIENRIIEDISNSINSSGIDRKIESIQNNLPKPNLYIDILITKISFNDVNEQNDDLICKVTTKYKIE